MKTLTSWLLIALVASAGVFAQDAEQKPVPTPDPKMEISDVETQIKTLEKDQLAPYADAWWELIADLESEVIDLGKMRDEAEGEDAKEIYDELIAKIEERNELVERLEVVRKEIALSDQEKSDAINAKIDSLKSRTDFADLTNPNELWDLAVGWLKSPTGGIKWGMRILTFIVILILARILSNIGAKIVSKTIGSSRMKTSNLLKDFFVNTTRKVILFAGILMAVAEIGIDIAPLLGWYRCDGFRDRFCAAGHAVELRLRHHDPALSPL